MKELLLLLFIGISTLSYGQNLDDLDAYKVDGFYKKLVLNDGTLDKDGNEIEYVYVKTEVEKGDYKVELMEGDGDLYEVKDANYYIKFNGYFDYATFSVKCFMRVDLYSAIVYKFE